MITNFTPKLLRYYQFTDVFKHSILANRAHSNDRYTLILNTTHSFKNHLQHIFLD